LSYSSGCAELSRLDNFFVIAIVALVELEVVLRGKSFRSFLLFALLTALNSLLLASGCSALVLLISAPFAVDSAVAKQTRKGNARDHECQEEYKEHDWPSSHELTLQGHISKRLGVSLPSSLELLVVFVGRITHDLVYVSACFTVCAVDLSPRVSEPPEVAHHGVGKHKNEQNEQWLQDLSVGDESHQAPATRAHNANDSELV